MGVMSSSPEQEPMDVVEVSTYFSVVILCAFCSMCDEPVVFTVLATLLELQVVIVYEVGDLVSCRTKTVC